jgi:hypothetical protein
MPWVDRGHRKYFYKSKRLPDGRIGKVYFGNGWRAEQAAKADAEAKRRREAARAEIRRIEVALQRLDDLVTELDECSNLLTMATLFTNGWHQHKGQWRKRRCGLDARF